YATAKGRSFSRESIARGKVLGAPVKPKGIRVNWNRPIPGPGEKAVFSLSFILTGICQNPLCMSKVENTAAPLTLSKISSGRGKG
ncbi:hypothetical protein T03_15293, partial [Trichinella britovi]